MSEVEATMDGEQILPQPEENQDAVQNLPQPDEKLWAPRKRGVIGEALAPVEGFGITFKSMFRKPVTEEYPEKPVPVNPRYHGRHQLNRYPDGLERCIGCELCAWACPADAIFVEAGANTPEEQYSPGERFGKVYQINYTRCIFCGYCIQACPTRALTMTTDFEIAGPTRASLIYEKKDLLAPLQEGMLEAPHPMAEGTTDDDYYDGKVTGATEAQKAWVRQKRQAQTGEEETNNA